MTTRTTQQKIGKNIHVGNLFLPFPDTDFREFLDETENLVRLYLEIIVAIEKDLDGGESQQLLAHGCEDSHGAFTARESSGPGASSFLI